MVTITVEISDVDALALKNDIIDINDWVQGAVAGKISSCKKRMIQDGTAGMVADPDYTDAIPSDEDDLVKLVASRTKDRAARDAEGR